MKVNLIPDVTYTVKTNDGEIKGCRVVSRWENFWKLEYTMAIAGGPFASHEVQYEKRHIIVRAPEQEHSFEALFRGMFSSIMKQDEVVEHKDIEVLGIAPSLVEILIPNPQKKP